jgi:hypothetical protein
MKNVAICSLMRAGSEYEQAYYLQILGLARRTFKLQSVNVVYDAEPAASAWLRELLASQGVPVYYEIEDAPAGDGGQFASRLSQWAASANQCLELALSHGEDLTHLAWVEADLSYPYDTMEALLAHDSRSSRRGSISTTFSTTAGDFATKTARELLRSNLTFPTHPTNRSS